MEPINLTTLGKYGRFGNQLFQYIFAKSYANKHNLVLHTNPWIGSEIFENINDPLPIHNLPRLYEDIIPTTEPYGNIDLIGYFQGPMHLKYWSKSYARELFKFKKEIIDLINPIRREFYIACHLRRGDYEEKYSDIFCIVKKEAYIEKVEELGYNESNIVWVGEEHPHRNSKLGKHEFLQDFFIMMHAPLLLRANSSFSWWSGTLGNNQVYSPVVKKLTGWQHTAFCKGNDEAPIWQPPFHEHLIVAE